jgi:hypothetical protein
MDWEAARQIAKRKAHVVYADVIDAVFDAIAEQEETEHEEARRMRAKASREGEFGPDAEEPDGY